VGKQTRRLLKLIATRSAEEMRNQVEFLSAWDCLPAPGLNDRLTVYVSLFTAHDLRLTIDC